MTETDEFLIETADRCKRIARMGRQLAIDLESLSDDLLARAVALETDRQKTQRGK